jgi:hypothetical protein
MSKLEIPAVPGTASADEVMAVLREHGCARILNLVDQAVMDRVESELWPVVARTPEGTGEFVGYRTRRVSALIAKSRACGELALNPLLRALADKTLGDRCDHPQLHVTQAVCIGPGEKTQPLHRDDAIVPFPHPMNGKEALLHAFWAVTEYTEENGATRAVPKSHLWDDERQPLDSEGVSAVMPRGSALVYVGSVYHGGGANRTKDQFRIGIIMGYSLGWLRQEENQYLVVPPKIAKTLPDELARLIGYSIQEPFMGWVEMQDPHIVLETDDFGTTAAADLGSPLPDEVRQRLRKGAA